MPARREFLAVLLAAGLARAQPALSGAANRADFDALWNAIDQGYAYFEGTRGAWKNARERWRPKAAAAKSRAELITAFEGALAHLQDDHATLSERTPRSPRRIPSETDIWATWSAGGALITAIRISSEADVAGLHPGQVVTHIEGAPLRATAHPSDWVLRHLLAGPRRGAYRLRVRDERGERNVEVERADSAPANGASVQARRIGEDRDLGYIRIRHGFGDPRLAADLDGALKELRETRALIVDLRDTTRTGSRSLTHSLLERFGERRAPLVALIDPWTAGEGEALAAGLEARGATLIGVQSAGLRGELGEAVLPASGIVLRFPAKKTPPLDAAKREGVRPAVEVDLAAPAGGPGDPILYQALKHLEKR